MSIDIELKPCAHCGAAPRYLEFKAGFYEEGAICDSCKYKLPVAIWQARAGIHQGPLDSNRLDFIEDHPEMQLRRHKKKWSMIGFTNYEFDIFKTMREAIDAAMARGRA